MNDDQRTDADLAVLDMALAEALTGRSAPDVWERLATREVPAAPQRARSRWLAAALLLLGLGVVVAIATMEKGSTAPDPGAVPAATDTNPDWLSKLREQARACRGAKVGAEGTWCEAARSWISFRPSLIGDRFAPRTAPAVADDDLAAIRASIETATLGPTADGVSWTHHLYGTETENTLVLRLRVGGNEPPLLGFATAAGQVLLNAPTFPFSSLNNSLESASKAMIQGLGLVLGPNGFGAVPTNATSLRLLAVPADRLAELTAFTNVTKLDLAGSPAWHAAPVLEALTNSRIRSLALSPSALTAESQAALGGMRSLTELFLATEPHLQLMGKQAADVAPTLDDHAIAGLSNLTQLERLYVSGGVFSDAAFGTFATMPALRWLALLGCRNTHGVGIEQCRKLTHLAVRSGDLCSDFAHRVASLPELIELALMETDLQAVADLAGSPQLKTLTLVGTFDTTELPALRHCASLRKLSIRATPPLRDDQLPLLHGLQQLANLGITSDQVTEAGHAALRAALPHCQIKNEHW